jgi:hypothetical protein
MHELLQEFTSDNANDVFPLWKRGIEGDFSVGKEIQMDAVYIVITVLFFVLCAVYVVFLSEEKP